MSRANQLKELISHADHTILMEAHNGLSAKLAQEAGFEALWASGLSISAALGVRDNNEASWTQVLEVLEFMSGRQRAADPARRRHGLRQLQQRAPTGAQARAARGRGVCIEDKLFPKTNSFIDGERQALAEVDEFCGKLRAAKDTQHDPDFVVVARTEAFIAGWGIQEALLRAHAYAESGADAILVHSKRSDADEVLSFAERWKRDTPLVIVPTKYPSEPLSRFAERGITNFIFANQSLRTVITALQRNLARLRETSDLMSIEGEIAPVSEVFRLQNVAELQSSEARYLPQTDKHEPMRALVLAASKGDFGDLVAERPKCMLYLGGKPILSTQIEAFNRHGIKQVGVVRGYRKEAVDLTGPHYFDNDEYATTGELFSLYAARDYLKGPMLIAYGDILFDDFILHSLLAESAPINIAADAAWTLRDRTGKSPDLVETSGVAAPGREGGCTLTRVSADLPPERASGEWVGLVVLSPEGTAQLAEALDEVASAEPELLRTGGLDGLLNRMVAAGHPINVVHTFGHWTDLDDETDLASARG